MCDVVAVIEKGRILATGTVQDILESVRQRRISRPCVSPDTDGARAVPARAARRRRTSTRRAAACSSSSTAATTSRSRSSASGRGGFPGARVQRAQRRPRGSVHRDHGGPRAVSRVAGLLALARGHERLAQSDRRQGSAPGRARPRVHLFVRGRACWPASRSRSSAPPTRSAAAAPSGRWTFVALIGCLALARAGRRAARRVQRAAQRAAGADARADHADRAVAAPRRDRQAAGAGREAERRCSPRSRRSSR